MATQPARKTMAPKRKGKKQRQLVSFEFEGFEGDFTLPALANLPLGVASALTNGDVQRLIEFIRDATSEDMAAAVEAIEGDETEAFMQAWSDASGVDSGK